MVVLRSQEMQESAEVLVGLHVVLVCVVGDLQAVHAH
jgi:hypothetical protein